MSESNTSGAWLNKEETKLRGLWLSRMFDQKDVAHVLAIHFGNPTPFAGRIEIGDELGNDVRRQGFERFVPSVLLRIAQAFPMDNPAHVSHAMRAQDVWYAVPASHKQILDGPHAVDELRTGCGRQALQCSPRLFIG